MAIAQLVAMADDGCFHAKSLFEALADSAPDAIITIDSESRMLSANRAVLRVFGYQPAELIGLPLTHLMPERLRARHTHGLARYLKSGAKNIPWTGVHLTGLTKDGTEIPIEISFGEFVDAQGTPVFSGFIRDISERVKQQRVLEGALADLQRQAHLLAAVEQAIVSTDRRGIVVSWNRYAETLYGWTAEEALGQHVSRLFFNGESVEQATAATLRLRAGEKVVYERQVRRKDGEIIWVSIAAAPILDADGKITGIVGVATDITGRLRLETQLLQAQKMEAIGRLAGGVAHDFNNLLTVINGHAEFLMETLPPQSEAADDVREIAKAGRRASALTRQLLAFSRQQRLEKRAINVNAIVADIEKMLGRLIGEDIEFTVDVGGEVPIVLADAGQLEQVLMNLVVNARDAMPKGGTLCITTRGVTPAPAKLQPLGLTPGPFASITVADSGTGMTPEVRSRLFEPFFTTKDAGHGTGLGLATVYGIVKQSGGFIEVESKVGRGSQFTIFLPATDRPEETAHAGAVPTESSSGTILLVEDQDEVRAIARRILASKGYKVIEASNGADALALLEDRGKQIDMVLTDAVMPKMSGPDLMRTIRVSRPRLPFVIVSGYTSDQLGRREADDLSLFLQKPFKHDRLLAAVKQVLENSRVIKG